MSYLETLVQEAQAFYIANRFNEHPEALDEAIALHYASMAAYAFQMKKLVEFRRCGRNDNCEQAIAYMREQIRKAHVHAFGMEPNWPTARADAARYAADAKEGKL